jgi:hypothetical protein
MVDKLKAAEMTFKELQLRMADPEVAASNDEFQKVRADLPWQECSGLGSAGAVCKTARPACS